jgi:hypothetical protein
MRIRLLLLYLGVASAWELPFHLERLLSPRLQRFFFGYNPAEAPRLPLQFDVQPNCSTFLTQLSHTDFVVYNYGLDENTPGAGRDLVNCLSLDNATEARSRITEVLIGLPLVGSPKPKQKAFIELIDMLPNITEIRYVISPMRRELA